MTDRHTWRNVCLCVSIAVLCFQALCLASKHCGPSFTGPGPRSDRWTHSSVQFSSSRPQVLKSSNSMIQYAVYSTVHDTPPHFQISAIVWARTNRRNPFRAIRNVNVTKLARYNQSGQVSYYLYTIDKVPPPLGPLTK